MWKVRLRELKMIFKERLEQEWIYSLEAQRYFTMVILGQSTSRNGFQTKFILLWEEEFSFLGKWLRSKLQTNLMTVNQLLRSEQEKLRMKFQRKSLIRMLPENLLIFQNQPVLELIWVCLVLWKPFLQTPQPKFPIIQVFKTIKNWEKFFLKKTSSNPLINLFPKIQIWSLNLRNSCRR